MSWAPLAALLLQLALLGSAAVVARRVRPLAVVLGAAAFVGAPWLAGPIPLVRGLDALLGGVALLRVVDLVRLRGDAAASWSAWRRVVHVASFVDSRTLRRAPPGVDLRALGRALLWGGLAVASLQVARVGGEVAPRVSPAQLARWGGGLVFVYAVIEAGYELIGAAHRLVGLVAPPLHVSPVASLSVGELWGARWARPVSLWLRDTCFRPLARRGHARLGLVLGFVASGAGHAYPVLVAVGAASAASMAAFFAAQAVFVLLESALGCGRWPRSARRVFTVVLMVASSPLFVEPALRVLGCAPRAAVHAG